MSATRARRLREEEEKREEEVIDQVRAAKKAKRKEEKDRQKAKKKEKDERYKLCISDPCPSAHWRSEWQKLELIEAAGWKNVSPVSVTALWHRHEAKVKHKHTDPLPTPLGVLRRLLPSSLIQSGILCRLNRQLATAREHHELKDPKYLHDLNEQLFWCFLAHKVAASIHGKILKKRGVNPVIVKSMALFGENRFHAVQERLQLGETGLKEFLSGMKTALLSVIELGSVSSLDDRIIAHFSQLMRDLGIAAKLPEKPHGYGLLVQVAAQILPYSVLRIHLDAEAKTPSNKPTIAEATVALVERLAPDLPPNSVFVADSASLSRKILPKLQRLPVKFAISVKSHRAADFQPLWELGQEELPHDHSRTYWNGESLLQIADRAGDHITSVITNAYAPAAAPPPAARPAFSYNLAVALLAEDVNAVKTLAPNLPNKEGMSQRKIIQSITGHDPFLPPGHSADRDVLSAAPLMALFKPQLQIIAGALPGKPPVSGLDKEALVDLILTNAGQETDTPRTGGRQRKRGMKLEIYRGDLRGPSFPDSAVVNFWAAHYGHIDQLNRELYTNFKLAGGTHWETSLFWTYIETLILNAFAIYYELRIERAAESAGGNLEAVLDAQRMKCETVAAFIIEILRELVAEHEHEEGKI